MSYNHFEADDIKQNALPAAIGYLVFPVPLLLCPKSKLGRFCANQGLLLAITFCIVRLCMQLLRLITKWIPLVGTLVSIAGFVVQIAIVLIGFLYAVSAYNGKPDKLPFIGEFELIH